jgi:sigma-E factor negative regulatory protein RseB
MALTLLPLSCFRRARWLAGLLAMCAAAAAVAAQPAEVALQPERGVNEWLMRMQDASRLRSYVGTFVVSSSTGSMSSARIWHAGDSVQQVERVEVLTGTPRSTFRRNDEVLTFLPELRVVRAERRESLGLFPNLLKSSDSSMAELYGVRRLGAERVAGFDADVVQLVPKDLLRYGYRVWSERRTGLVVKLQTLDADGTVLEQAAFSELQLDSPVRAEKLAQMMQPPRGWRIERAEVVKTSPSAEGWGLRGAVAGFKPVDCYKRPASGGSPAGGIQWIFSDGLASVSLFVEPFDRNRHQQEGVFAAGATQTLTRRVDDWWLTVVGEVPPQALKAFAQSLERRR